jgi:hypothetical protein
MASLRRRVTAWWGIPQRAGDSPCRKLPKSSNEFGLVEKGKLLKEVWPDSFVEEGTLNRSVSVLRKALGESPSEQKFSPRASRVPLEKRLVAGATYACAELGCPMMGIRLSSGTVLGTPAPV